MNSKYPKVALTELLSVIIDNRGKTCPTVDSGFPLIATNCIKHTSIYPTFENLRYVSEDVKNNWFRAKLMPNDILFVNKGTPGRCCLVPDPVNFCAAQDMIGLRIDSSKAYYKYIFAVLRSEYVQEQIKNYHVGVAIPHFKKENLNIVLIPLPDMETQIKIGDLYCLISEKIEKNNKLSDELADISKKIFEQYFLQFNFPDSLNHPYNENGGEMVWNDYYRHTIPVNWTIKELRYYLNCNVHSAGKIDEMWYLDTGNLTDNRIFTIKHIRAEDGYPSRAKRLVVNNDILFSTVRPVQRHYGFLKNVRDKLVASTGFAILSSKIDPIYNSIFYLYIISDHVFNKLVSISETSTSSYPSISNDDILDIPICLPEDINLIKNIAEKIDSIFEYIDHLQKENQELTSLRDFLLPLLINGQIKFNN